MITFTSPFESNPSNWFSSSNIVLWISRSPPEFDSYLKWQKVEHIRQTSPPWFWVNPRAQDAPTSQRNGYKQHSFVKSCRDFLGPPATGCRGFPRFTQKLGNKISWLLHDFPITNFPWLSNAENPAIWDIFLLDDKEHVSSFKIVRDIWTKKRNSSIFPWLLYFSKIHGFSRPGKCIFKFHDFSLPYEPWLPSGLSKSLKWRLLSLSVQLYKFCV